MTLTAIKDRLLVVIGTVLGRGSHRVSGPESLTIDLGMDSLNLMQLFSLIESEIGAVDLLPWLVSSGTEGCDSVDGLCRYVANALQTA